MIKRGIKKALSAIGYEVKQIPKNGPNPIHLWETDPYFGEMFRSIQAGTLVDRKRCFMLYQFFKQSKSLGGDIAEIGVYKGGTAKLFAQLVDGDKINKNIYLFDTFEGMPETSKDEDFHKKGDFSDTSLEGVSKFVGSYKNVSFHKGFFPDTSGPIKDKFFSFVHVDVDIYKSVNDCCDFFYPRMVKGGIIIFDDYGFLSCPGAKKAVDDFFRDKIEQPIYLQSGQCVVVKL